MRHTGNRPRRERSRPTLRLGGRISAVVAVVALATSLAFVSAASADTANSGVYAVAWKYGGYCAGKYNYATYVYYINYTTGNRGGDSGDDIVWMRVVNGKPNSVQVGVQCRLSTPIAMNFTITPTRYGQTWWFSLWGQTWHN